MTEAACGIDFGTTNSAIAVVTGAGVEPVPISRSEPSQLLRSVIYVDRDGLILAGETALHQYSVNALKQHACARCSYAHFSKHGLHTSCSWGRAGGGCGDSRLIVGPKEFLAQAHISSTHSWGHDYAIEELVAAVLLHLRQTAERHIGRRVRRSVVGLPVRFAGENTPEDRNRALDRLRVAGELAGFDEIEFMLEPEAAGEARMLDRGRYLVVDFGGGTFDAVVLEVGPGGRKLLGRAGVAVAGEELTARIVDLKLARRFGFSDADAPRWLGESCRTLAGACFLLGNPRRLDEISDAARSNQRLKDYCKAIMSGHVYALYDTVDQAKMNLSTQSIVLMQLEKRDLDLSMSLTRAEFEAGTAPQFASIADTLTAAIDVASIRASDLRAVICTGGSSQIPAFRRLLRAMLPKVPVEDAPPFTAVVEGLGRRAADL